MIIINYCHRSFHPCDSCDGRKLKNIGVKHPHELSNCIFEKNGSHPWTNDDIQPQLKAGELSCIMSSECWKINRLYMMRQHYALAVMELSPRCYVNKRAS